MPIVPESSRLLDVFEEPEALPDWLSPEDLDVYTEEFERTGCGAIRRHTPVLRRDPYQRQIVPDRAGQRTLPGSNSYVGTCSATAASCSS
ncbi:MAG: hypothetical protein M3O70_16270 [Actinomycetota bacterium]|nr:hypothetical protein [Actinomycetota bacterium]